MTVTTVHFSPDVWDLLEGEAKRQGVSVAQFVREAAVFRVSSVMARREFDADPEAKVERIITDAVDRSGP